MTNYIQEIVAETILTILNRYTYEVLRSDEFQPVVSLIRNALIRQYQEHPENADSTWQDIVEYKAHFQWSPRAFRAYRKALHNGIPESAIAQSKNGILHFEHMVPNHVILSKIMKLKETTAGLIPIEQVKNVLDQSAIVILSKEEAELLDGNPNRTYSVEGAIQKGCGMRSKGEKHERLAALGIEKLFTFAELATASPR